MLQCVFLIDNQSTFVGGTRHLSTIPDLRHVPLCIGTKQTLRALERGNVERVYVAMDADASMIAQVVALASRQRVDVVRVDAMRALGRACGIDVGAAMAAVLKPEHMEVRTIDA
ncbi:MAG: ribosomal L7Ae/L30e/S12e/Gadd45 family protein [Paenibacillaceae bacterium]|nr:ribosomal L7Ae/L30e/S12e/Gadd45 family protein [Paenibacillaceae bacterium]